MSQNSIRWSSRAARGGATSLRCASAMVRRSPGRASGVTRSPRPAAAGHHAGHHGHAEPRPDETQHRVHLPALHREVRLEALGAAGGHGQLPQVVAVPEHHQRLALAGRRCARAGRRPAAALRRRHHHQVLPQQLHRGQRGGRRRQRQHDQGQVEGAARQLPYEIVRAALLDQQLDARMPVVEGAQHVRQQARAQARRGAQPDPPAAQLGQLLHLVPGRVRVGQDAAGQRQQRLAGVGERDVAAGPAEQVRAQLPLQRLDLLGERGLGDVDPLGGPGEVPGLGDRHEVVELLELHGPRIRPR